MFALFTSGSLVLSGFFWGWALVTGGAVVDARTAAMIFGWLCIASIAIGIVAVRRGSDYDRPSPAFAGALATTLFTGVAILYLAYFEWRPVMAFAEAQAAPMVPAAPMAQAKLALAEKPATPAQAPRAAPARPKARLAIAKVADACAAFKGVEKQQCRRCGKESGIAGFICRENARAEFCAGRDGSEPGCPWRGAPGA